MPGIGIAIAMPFGWAAATAAATTHIIADESSVEFTLTTWQTVIDGTTDIENEELYNIFNKWRWW